MHVELVDQVSIHWCPIGSFIVLGWGENVILSLSNLPQHIPNHVNSNRRHSKRLEARSGSYLVNLSGGMQLSLFCSNIDQDYWVIDPTKQPKIWGSMVDSLIVVSTIECTLNTIRKNNKTFSSIIPFW